MEDVVVDNIPRGEMTEATYQYWRLSSLGRCTRSGSCGTQNSRLVKGLVRRARHQAIGSALIAPRDKTRWVPTAAYFVHEFKKRQDCLAG
jgi:hypothetical protein